MYVWISGERWAEDGQPPLTEEHGWLVSQPGGSIYGQLLKEDEDRVVGAALYAHRHPLEPPLFAEPGRRQL